MKLAYVSLCRRDYTQAITFSRRLLQKNNLLPAAAPSTEGGSASAAGPLASSPSGAATGRPAQAPPEGSAEDAVWRRMHTYQPQNLPYGAQGPAPPSATGTAAGSGATAQAAPSSPPPPRCPSSVATITLASVYLAEGLLHAGRLSEAHTLLHGFIVAGQTAPKLLERQSYLFGVLNPQDVAAASQAQEGEEPPGHTPPGQGSQGSSSGGAGRRGDPRVMDSLKSQVATVPAASEKGKRAKAANVTASTTVGDLVTAQCPTIGPFSSMCGLTAPGHMSFGGNFVAMQQAIRDVSGKTVPALPESGSSRGQSSTAGQQPSIRYPTCEIGELHEAQSLLYTNLAGLCAMQQDLTEAERLAELALRMHPTSLAPLRTLVYVLLSKGKHQQALGLLKRRRMEEA